jgi:2,3-dihydroxybenzoate-AMP ligase/mycobactin salicyl-AMP ligase
MNNILGGVVPYEKQDADKYSTLRWWAGLILGDIFDRAADIFPEKEAF